MDTCAIDAEHDNANAHALAEERNAVPSTALLGGLHFRAIITFLRNGGKRLSAAWLARAIDHLSGGHMTIREALEYVDGCHVCIRNGYELSEPNVSAEVRRACEA